MPRKPQRTEIELPSGSTATIRKATARDMRDAEQANIRRQQDNLAAMDETQLTKLRTLSQGNVLAQGTNQEPDPDRALLERHDAETLVDRCTISIDGAELFDAEEDDAAPSWFDNLDADDHAALFEGIMWFSRVRPSKKAS